jgi:hypothetical protein
MLNSVSRPIAGMAALRAQPTAIEHPQTQPDPLWSWEHSFTLNMTQTGQRARSLSSALVQLAKKPIVLQLTSR